MSPASQGNLEVERYIGSCLISSSVRVSNASGKSNNSSNNNINYKGKKVADCGGPRPGKLQTGVLNHRSNGNSGAGGGGGNSATGVVGNCQDHHFGHIAAGGYPSPGSLLPLCECGGLKFGGARYGSPGPNAGVGGSWAGLPLISMAPSNARRNRKPSTSSNGSVNSGRNVKNTSAGPHSTTSVVTGTNGGKNNTDVDHTSQQSRTPLSRLAIHTQGAPLILAGRYNINGRKNNVNHNRGPPGRQFRGGDIAVRRSNSVRDTRDTGGSAGSTNNSNGNTPNSDCLSVASDESSGHSENSLPRIIKPRKRRKKDRKPPPQTNTSPPDTPNSSIPNELKSTSLDSPSIVSLQPYAPLCYDLYENGCWNGGRRNVTKDDSEERSKIWESDSKRTLGSNYAVEIPRDDEQVSQSSEEDNQEPKLHHNFDDVEEDEEGQHIETGALFSYPCPPTLCQCRYCDPSGLIWDVDQHCYSPFLTPPSPTAENKNSSYSKSPFSNIPLFLTPPPTEVRSFDFLNKDVRTSPTPSVFLHDSDHSSSLLRRSWSEPLPSSLRSGSVASKDQECCGNFGAIGRGRINSEGNNESVPSKDRKQQNNTEEVSSPVLSVSGSQSLEVSTEIVTSPNGHRDIEIKFYSSSPPAATAVIPVEEIKNAPDGSARDEKRTSSCPPDEEIDRQEVISVWENAHKEPSDGSVCVRERERSSAVDKQASNVKVKCKINKKIVCEQRAKNLGEEVNQLRLHAEE
ncbi:hypothetical protein C0J52_23895 [Blattella germanica]|nr:hypothetical protein C0J52_23895 [Blattella germanica]